MVQEALDVLWRVHTDEVVVALIQQELQLAFSVFTLFHLLRVGELVGRVLLVQVDEMSHSKVTKRIHDIPGIILGDCQLIKPHYLGSTVQESAKNYFTHL